MERKLGCLVQNFYCIRQPTTSGPEATTVLLKSRGRQRKTNGAYKARAALFPLFFHSRGDREASFPRRSTGAVSSLRGTCTALKASSAAKRLNEFTAMTLTVLSSFVTFFAPARLLTFFSRNYVKGSKPTVESPAAPPEASMPAKNFQKSCLGSCLTKSF